MTGNAKRFRCAIVALQQHAGIDTIIERPAATTTQQVSVANGNDVGWK